MDEETLRHIKEAVKEILARTKNRNKNKELHIGCLSTDPDDPRCIKEIHRYDKEVKEDWIELWKDYDPHPRRK